MAAAVEYNLSAGDLDEIYESCKNWGRWGADDQAGTLNLLTDEVRACCSEARAPSAARLPGEPSAETGAGVPSHDHCG
jgi:hypothetical protein